MTLEILSPEKTLFRGEAERVTLPGASGEFTVLRNHAPIISALVRGNVKYVEKVAREELGKAKAGETVYRVGARKTNDHQPRRK